MAGRGADISPHSQKNDELPMVLSAPLPKHSQKEPRLAFRPLSKPLRRLPHVRIRLRGAQQLLDVAPLTRKLGLDERMREDPLPGPVRNHINILSIDHK